jgi:hypothetical protein
MSATKDEAMTAADLFDIARIPTSTTGKNALKELFSIGRIERTGKSGSRDPFLYSLTGPPEPRKRKSKVRHTQAIQAILKGEGETPNS